MLNIWSMVHRVPSLANAISLCLGYLQLVGFPEHAVGTGHSSTFLLLHELGFLV